MATDENLTGSDSVRDFQRVLHVKAKEDPKRRFHALYDKVWRKDFLFKAWQQVRRNGGSAGVDRETFQDIAEYGVERWLGELARDLKEGTYTPRAVRQVLIPKKEPGKFRPLGIPCIRDRVVQMSALLVLVPIFEADLQEEQYAYRKGRGAQEAVKQAHRLTNTGHREVVDADLRNFFGEIPHAEMMKSIARRVSDGRMLRLIKAWLVMPVEEDDGKGGKRLTNRARKEKKGTPQGAPISPLLSNIYMRRFILAWKVLGYAQRFQAKIVCYADDFVILGKSDGTAMLKAVEDLMRRLKLPINAKKTRCVRCPEEPFTFLGYRIGRNYRPRGRGSYIGTRPNKKSVQSICRKISEQTAARHGQLSTEEMVQRLNWLLTGWANYFCLGQVSPAYKAIDAHTTKRIRRWLCRKHKVQSGGWVRFPHAELYEQYGLIRLAQTTKRLPWAKT